MTNRDFSLSKRLEDVRDSKCVDVPVQFSLVDIRQHFEESLNSVKAQYSVADSLEASGKHGDCKTIWRSQIVLVEGLLDFFIHEISKYCLFRMFTGRWEKSEKYIRLMVPMEVVENAINVIESKDWFFDYLNKRFSRDVFLSHDSMKEQLNLIGIGFTEAMEKAFPNQTEACKYGSKIVKELFQRRNEIAHQNDRSHASAQQTDISKQFVEEYIKNVEAIVSGINQIAVNKDLK